MPTSQPSASDSCVKPHKPSSLSVDLRSAVLQLARRIRQERSDEAITLSELAVLGVLSFHGAMTPGRLADHEQISPPSMTRTLAGLVAKGYVLKSGDPSDRRQVLIEITGAGAEVVKETRHRRTAWLSRRLAKLEPDQRAILADAVRIMGTLSGTHS